MPRMSHGSTVSLDEVQQAIAAIEAISATSALPMALAAPIRLTDFNYMFPTLQVDPANLLAIVPATPVALEALGNALIADDTADNVDENDRIPAVYTYLGQFIDHDITLEAVSDDFTFGLTSPDVLQAAEILERIKNLRTATLDLDSVYASPAPFDDAAASKLLVGKVTPDGPAIPGKDEFNDLPRTSRRATPPSLDRAARTGDARNDENLIISQLHVAFLHAHNALVDQGRSFTEARRDLRRLYQWIVVHDFLVKVAGQNAVDKALQGNTFFTPDPNRFFIPLEFTVAAYRFGHSMIRGAYDFNRNFGAEDNQLPEASLGLLFTFTALSGGLGFGNGFDTLPHNWVIEWERLVEMQPNPALPIDTRLTKPLSELQTDEGAIINGMMGKLAVRNLLRGYHLRMPTGQAVARHMQAIDATITPLTTAQILGVAANRPTLATALNQADLATRTPLWFYILAEAEVLAQGKHLGPVGATIVAEVLVEMVRQSEDSILAPGMEGWSPAQLDLEVLSPDNVTIKDLLKLAGVLA